jgi:hypothetical protein
MSAEHGRLVLITGLFLGYVLFTSFSTMLVSQLAVGHYPSTPPASVILSSYRIFVLDAGILAAAQAKKGPWAKARLAYDVGLVCQDNVALLVETNSKFLVPCEVKLLPEKYFQNYWGFVMKKDVITARIRKMFVFILIIC